MGGVPTEAIVTNFPNVVDSLQTCGPNVGILCGLSTDFRFRLLVLFTNDSQTFGPNVGIIYRAPGHWKHTSDQKKTQAAKTGEIGLDKKALGFRV